MALALVFVGLPVATYPALVCLPRDRVAGIGIAVAAALCAGLWVYSSLGDAGAIGDGFIPALFMPLFSATALAAIVQLIRHIMGAGKPAWVYPALIAVAFLAAGIPMMNSLGV